MSLNAQVSWQDTLEHYIKTPPPQAIKGLEKALIHKDIPDSSRLDMLAALVNDYAQMRMSDSARSTALRAYKLATSGEDQRRIARASLSKAWTARDLGLSEEVLAMALEAEKLAKEVDNPDLLLMAYNTLASVYYDVKNDSLQKEYLIKSYETAKAHNLELKAFNAMSNLGYIYLKEGEYKKAEELFKRAIRTRKEIDSGNRASFYMEYSHLIDLFELRAQYDSCVVYVDSLLSISVYGGWKDYIILNQNMKAYYQRKAGYSIPLNKVLLGNLNAIDIAGFTIDEQKAFLWKKSIVNEEFGNYKKALGFTKAFNTLTDSLNQAELRDQVAYYKEQFDAEQRENTITQLENENEIAALKAEQLSTRIIWLISAISLFSILIGFLIYFYVRLRKTTKELRALNHVKDKFFAIVSHDLRNSITAFNGMGDVIDRYIEREKWDRLKALGGKLDTESKKLNVFLNDLLNWSLTQVNHVPYHPKQIGVRGQIDQVLTLLEDQLNGKADRVEVVIDDQQKVYADQNAFDLVVRNLVTNACKFSHEGGTIFIGAETQSKMLRLTIADQGIGMTNEQQQQLFQVAKKSSKGTQGESGSGLGLVLVKEFLTINRGEITVDSELQKGTTFTITLPTEG